MIGLRSRFEVFPDEMMRQAKQLARRTGLPVRIMPPHRAPSRDPRKRRRARWNRPANTVAGAVVVGQFAKSTAAASTTNTITGMPGTPKLVLLFGNRQTANGFVNTGDQNWGWGAADGTSLFSMTHEAEDNQTTINQSVTNSRNYSTSCFFIRQASTGSVLASANGCTMNSDGFTLTWGITNNAEAWLIGYLALIAGTADIKAKLVAANAPTSTGNWAITGAGFAPKAVIVMSNHYTNVGTGQMSYSGGGGMLGFTDGTSQMVMSSAQLEITGSSSRGFHRNDAVICQHDPSPVTTVDWLGSIVSLDSDGCTINLTTVFTNANRFGFIFLGGADLSVKVGTKSLGTGTGSVATTGVGFMPAGLMLMSINRASSNSIQNNEAFMVGFGDNATNQNVCVAHDTNGSSASTEANVNSSTLIMAGVPSTPTDTDIEASLTSVDADGFTLNESKANGVAVQISYLALGVPSVAASSSIKAKMYQYRKRRG